MNVSKWLKNQQDILQKSFKEMVKEENTNYGSTGKCTGVWLHSQCANCSREFPTVYYIPHNDRCQDCGCLFYKKSRHYESKMRKHKKR